MTNLPENAKINLNQNLWALSISLAALGLSELYCLNYLFYISLILCIIIGTSYIITLIPYTINYWRNKMRKNN